MMMTTEAFQFRRATESDLDRISEIHLVAFPDARTEPERRRNFTASRFGNLEDLVLIERRGEILGHAFLFALEAWFGGRGVAMGGVASVAVAPEARGQGVATALLDHVHAASDARGDALTMLYAFRQRFYARFGYGTTSSRKRFTLDPRSIPSAWIALANARVRRARGTDRQAVAAAYVRSASKASGWFTRQEKTWDRKWSRERPQVLVAELSAREGETELAGYIVFDVAQGEEHAATLLRVEEIVANDDVSRRALLGALARLRDQVFAIELEVDSEDVLEQALVDSDGRSFGTKGVEHTLGVIVGGPMVRIQNVPRAFEARGYAAAGAFNVVIDEPHGEGLDSPASFALSVRIEGGRATVSESRDLPCVMRTTRAALGSLLYGGLRLADAVRLGLVEADVDVVAHVGPLLATAPLAPVDPF